jgi:WXG100 family type VII secretion target
MPSFHVDTDQLLLAARSFWQNSTRLSDQIFILRVLLHRLEMAWQGGSAEEYQADLKGLIDSLNTRMNELNELGLTLSHQAEAWDESDQKWTGNYRESVN